MASLSLDMTGLLMIGINYKDSSYAPHARTAERILDEEAEHEVFAVGELASAVDRFGPRRWPRRSGNGCRRRPTFSARPAAASATIAYVSG